MLVCVCMGHSLLFMEMTVIFHILAILFLSRGERPCDSSIPLLINMMRCRADKAQGQIEK